jgi:hypothetical protein
MNAAALPPLLHRMLAAGGAALVLALSILAASPQAHAWLHSADHHGHAHHHPHHDDAGSEDACAVVLFAAGVALPAALLVPMPPAALAAGTPRLAATEILLVSPRYRLQPERGPPVNQIS